MPKYQRYTVIDLFAGCGGLSLGLYQAGWNGLFAIEKNAFAFETLKYNLIDNKKHFDWPNWLPQTEHDINEVLEKYPEQLKSLQGKVDLVAGGPPCQGFSMAGKRECARIQSFPDWYEFKKKYTTGGKMRKVEVPRYTQIGNAIPPLFAEQAGLVAKKILLSTE